jgi:hypothetical protein
LFGGTPAPAAAGTGIFGAPAPSAGARAAGLFGAPAASSGAAGLFGGLGGIGGSGAAAPALGFGGTPAPAAAGTGIFGATATSAGAPAAGLFVASSSGVFNFSSGGVSFAAGPFVNPSSASNVATENVELRNLLPRRAPRSQSQTDFLKEFLGPIEELIETQLAQNKKQADEAKNEKERDSLKNERKALEVKLKEQSIKFQQGSRINMSEAVHLHQEHVNQCKAILKFCGAKELQVKEERSLKTALDDDFQKYSRH